MEVQTPGQAFTAFLGALGFTRPVEQLELRSVPLPSLLFWLRRPKGINLVEATMPAGEAGSTSACRSMAIAVSEEMLYKDKCPLVGVGLVYTPPYVPRVQFSVAYMNLGAWRDATEESEDRLVGTRLMFIHASEASEFLPVAEEHPVLLDIMLVCGGCHTKSVCLGQALQKHMKDNCPAIVAILGKTRGGKK